MPRPTSYPHAIVPRCRRTFYRIWAFLILEFHFMAVMLWGYKNWYALCSVALDHAFLSLLEQVAGAWTQRAPGVCVCACAREEGGRGRLHCTAEL